MRYASITERNSFFFANTLNISDKPLYALFSTLFVIAAEPQTLVSEVFASGVANVGFLRSLMAMEQIALDNPHSSIERVPLGGDQDSIRWELEPLVKFSVKSTYAKLVHGPNIRYARALWASQVPPRVRIFLWQVAQDRLPSAINLKKCHGPGNGCCALCGVPEDANHILFRCASTKFLWS